MVRGVVAVVGADPLAEVVVSAGGRSAAVVGGLRAELGRLHGAEVEVRGRAVGNPHGTPGWAIDVERYQIIAIAGERPFVGTLEARAGGLWVDGMRLVGAPDDLVGAVGAKVWVIGRNEDGRLAAQHHQVRGAHQAQPHTRGLPLGRQGEREQRHHAGDGEGHAERASNGHRGAKVRTARRTAGNSW